MRETQKLLIDHTTALIDKAWYLIGLEGAPAINEGNASGPCLEMLLLGRGSGLDQEFCTAFRNEYYQRNGDSKDELQRLKGDIKKEYEQNLQAILEYSRPLRARHRRSIVYIEASLKHWLLSKRTLWESGL